MGARIKHLTFFLIILIFGNHSSFAAMGFGPEIPILRRVLARVFFATNKDASVTRTLEALTGERILASEAELLLAPTEILIARLQSSGELATIRRTLEENIVREEKSLMKLRQKAAGEDGAVDDLADLAWRDRTQLRSYFAPQELTEIASPQFANRILTPELLSQIESAQYTRIIKPVAFVPAEAEASFLEGITDALLPAGQALAKKPILERVPLLRAIWHQAQILMLKPGRRTRLMDPPSPQTQTKVWRDLQEMNVRIEDLGLETPQVVSAADALAYSTVAQEYREAYSIYRAKTKDLLEKYQNGEAGVGDVVNLLKTEGARVLLPKNIWETEEKILRQIDRIKDLAGRPGEGLAGQITKQRENINSSREVLNGQLNTPAKSELNKIQNGILELQTRQVNLRRELIGPTITPDRAKAIEGELSDATQAIINLEKQSGELLRNTLGNYANLGLHHQLQQQYSKIDTYTQILEGPGNGYIRRSVESITSPYAARLEDGYYYITNVEFTEEYVAQWSKAYRAQFKTDPVFPKGSTADQIGAAIQDGSFRIGQEYLLTPTQISALRAARMRHLDQTQTLEVSLRNHQRALASEQDKLAALQSDLLQAYYSLLPYLNLRGVAFDQYLGGLIFRQGLVPPVLTPSVALPDAFVVPAAYFDTAVANNWAQQIREALFENIESWSRSQAYWAIKQNWTHWKSEVAQLKKSMATTLTNIDKHGKELVNPIEKALGHSINESPIKKVIDEFESKIFKTWLMRIGTPVVGGITWYFADTIYQTASKAISGDLTAKELEDLKKSANGEAANPWSQGDVPKIPLAPQPDDDDPWK